MHNLPISMVLSGPISSRIDEKISVNDVEESFSIFKKINSQNEIIISTYKNEVPQSLFKLADKVIINDDPGPDKYKLNPWPISKVSSKESNISRMLQTTLNGIYSCSNDLVLKTRIELIPNNEVKFKDQLNRIFNKVNFYESTRIVFLTEHFSGISFAIDGTLAGIPDTFQIASKKTLLELWQESNRFWTENFNELTRKGINFPITSEQVLGLNYLKLYCNLPIEGNIEKLHKYYVSKTLLSSQINAEKKLYVLVDYKTFGLSTNYFYGSSKIKTSNISNLNNKKKIIFRLLIVFLKQVKHLIRRCIVGLKHH